MPKTAKPVLLDHQDAPPSPKQKRLFCKLSGHDLHPDIRSRAGAGMAIQAILTQARQKSLNNVQLPWGCFCVAWSGKGMPLRSSLVDTKYSEGMTLRQLYRSVANENKVKRQVVEAKPKLEAETFSRPAKVFKAPKLSGEIEVRRVYTGG